MSTIDLACVQLGPAGETSVSQRVAEVVDLVTSLGDADVVVLPEMWPQGYFAFDEYRAVAQPADGEIASALSEAARRASVHLVGGSFVEARPDGRLHNTSLVFGPGGERLALYRKVHVFGYGSRESELVSHGEGPAVVEASFGGIGLAICYDLRFPELFRSEVDAGAKVFVVPAAWPEARVEHWRLLLRARAVENLAFVVGCNGAGRDHDVDVGGFSAIIEPRGDVLAEAGAEPTVLRARLDLDAVDAYRDDFPALDDRRLPYAVAAS